MFKRHVFGSTIARLSICITIFTAQFAIPSRAYACEGPKTPPSIEEEFQNSSAVFLGTVTYVGFNYAPFASLLNKFYDKLYPPPPHYFRDMFSGVRVDFEVKNSWKYVSQTKISLRDHDYCGYGYKGFIPGKDYLIYAYLSDNNLESDLNIDSFSRTLEASNATEDLSYLKTQPTFPLMPVKDTRWIYGLGAIAFLLILGFIKRSKRLE